MSHLLDVEEGAGSAGPPHLGPAGRLQGSAQAGVPTAETGLRAQWGGTGHSPCILPVLHQGCLGCLFPQG